MKRVAFVSAITTTGILALAGFRVGSIALGCAAIVIGAVWLLILWKSVKRTELTILLGAETAIAVLGVLYGASVYLAGIAIVLAIMSWDFALTETAIASFPAEMTKRFIIRHVIRIGIIAVIGFALLDPIADSHSSRFPHGAWPRAGGVHALCHPAEANEQA